MKNYNVLIAFLFISVFAHAQLKTPALSPAATVQQTVGLTDIEVNYSRPAVKKRVVFGKEGLLPDNTFWRLGANAATKFSFSRDITIAGKALEKGNYTMLVKPNAQNWEFSVYAYESTDWNTYVEQTPLVRFSANVERTKDLQESFEIAVQDITAISASLEFHWEQTRVSVPFHVATMDAVMTNIDDIMKGPSLNDYFQAALFMHENQKDLPRALAYIQNVTKTNEARFFVVYREALILKDLNKKEEAFKSAKRSLALSKKAKNKDFVRLNEQLIASLK